MKEGGWLHTGLVIINVVIVVSAAALTLAVGVYGLSFLGSIWYVPTLMLGTLVLAAKGSSLASEGRSRLGLRLMLAPLVAAACALMFLLPVYV